MPYVSNGGVDTYYRTDPAGVPSREQSKTPLLLAHGFMQQCNDWFQAGYVDQLLKVRPLILVDFRGHGLSDKPHHVADYRMDLLVRDLVHVLDDLDVTAVDFMGYSFGAWVGFGMARFAPHRLRSVVLGGMHPYVRDPTPLDRRIDRFTRTMDALAAGGRHSKLIPGLR